MAEGAATATTMAALLSMIGEIVTAAGGWIATIVGIITSTPIFMIGIVIAFIGVAVGLVSRLLHL